MEIKQYYKEAVTDAEIREMSESKLHLVCMASIRNEVCKNALCTVFSIHKAEDYVNYVNNKGESGNFYPKLNLTIYPVFRSGMHAADVVNQIAEDIITSNKEHINASKVLVVINPAAGYPVDIFVQILQNRLNDYASVLTGQDWYYLVEAVQ